MTEIGYVKRVRNFLAYVDGLPGIRISNLVQGDGGAFGYVSALHDSEVEVLVLEGEVRPGMTFRPTGYELSLPVGDFLLGRTINPLGRPLDGDQPFPKNAPFVPLEGPAPGIADREFITRQFETGVSLIDTVIPIGKGQRELVVGDARSGKTGFVIDVIINQKNKNTICVYGTLGKPTTEIRNLINIFRQNGAMAYTVVVASFSADAAPLIFLTPQAAIAVAQFFQRRGRDVLLVLDDLGSHARIYREISLLSERPPGREAYPGDVFYQHAHLLERAGSFNKNVGGGSITALPLIELDLNDFTNFIPTNLMSMTDGHLLFRSSLYSQGFRPAVDLFLSVSRVGQQTQNRLQNELAFRIKQLMSQAESLSVLASFSVELPLSTQIILRQKEMLGELMKQEALADVPLETQVIVLALPFTKWGQEKDGAFFQAAKNLFLKALEEDPALRDLKKNVFNFKSLEDLLKKLDEMSPELIKVSEVLNMNKPGLSEALIVDSETWMPKF